MRADYSIAWNPTPEKEKHDKKQTSFLSKAFYKNFFFTLALMAPGVSMESSSLLRLLWNSQK